VGGEFALERRPEFPEVDRVPGCRFDHCGDALSPLGIRDADDGGVANIRQ
jgi:hypothetical protein